MPRMGSLYIFTIAHHSLPGVVIKTDGVPKKEAYVQIQQVKAFFAKPPREVSRKREERARPVSSMAAITLSKLTK